MLPPRSSQVLPAVVASVGLFLCGGPAWAEPSEYCEAFFESVLERVDGEGYYFRPLEGLAQVPLCLNGESAVCLGDDGTEFELPVGYFLAVELPAGVDLGRTDATWEINGKRLAVCSESPWYPPPIRVNSYAALSAGVALANAAWDAASDQVPYKDTFVRSRGNGVLLQDASLDLSGFPDAEDGDTVSLVRQYTENAAGAALDPRVEMDEVTVTGDEGTDAVLVRVVAATSDGLACDAAGAFAFEGVSWSSLTANSAVLESQCLDTGGFDRGGDFASGTQVLSLALSTLAGGGSTLHAQPLAASVGALHLEDVSVSQMGFSGSAVFSATTNMTVSEGSSFVGLTSSSDGEAALVVTNGDLKAQDVLFSDLEGWGTVVGGSTVGLGGAYVCGVQAGALMASSSDPGGNLDLVSSAVVGTQLASGVGQGVVAAAEPGTVRLANVLFAGLSKDGSLPTSLASNGADLEGTNLLAYQSLATAGTEDVSADGVRLWSDETAGLDCGSWGLPSGCATLSDAPAFTGQPSVLLQADCSAVAASLQELVAAEDEGGDEILRVESLGFLPVLFTDQTDLVGVGSAWDLEDSLLDCAPPEGAAVDVGAYGGPCSLSFLAPLEVDDADDTGDGDSGALDTARPETDGGGAGTAIPGLGAGCRYGSLGGLVLLPLGVAWRRRRHGA